MKHLPNLLTLANLFCGCAAISFILSAQNFTTTFNMMDYVEVPAIEQPYWGSVFILMAAIFDLLDGFTARALKIYSPIGKDLDSLADMVSFGVAPSMILFKMLWAAHIIEPGALDVPMLAMTPAFLLACFAALRLAKFNTTASEQKNYFIGMPTPAVGMMVASFPLIIWLNPSGLAAYAYSPWILYAIIALICYLMVSKIRFFKLLPKSWDLKNAWQQIVVISLGAALIFMLKIAAIPAIFILYILLSILKQPKDLQTSL